MVITSASNTMLKVGSMKLLIFTDSLRIIPTMLRVKGCYRWVMPAVPLAIPTKPKVQKPTRLSLLAILMVLSRYLNTMIWVGWRKRASMGVSKHLSIATIVQVGCRLPMPTIRPAKYCSMIEDKSPKQKTLWEGLAVSVMIAKVI